jgi:hypothetical protein
MAFVFKKFLTGKEKVLISAGSTQILKSVETPSLSIIRCGEVDIPITKEIPILESIVGKFVIPIPGQQFYGLVLSNDIPLALLQIFEKYLEEISTFRKHNISFPKAFANKDETFHASSPAAAAETPSTTFSLNPPTSQAQPPPLPPRVSTSSLPETIQPEQTQQTSTPDWKVRTINSITTGVEKTSVCLSYGIRTGADAVAQGIEKYGKEDLLIIS